MAHSIIQNISRVLTSVALVALISCGVRPDGDSPKAPTPEAVVIPTVENTNTSAPTAVTANPSSDTAPEIVPSPSAPFVVLPPLAEVPAVPSAPLPSVEPIPAPTPNPSPLATPTPTADVLDWAYVSAKVIVPNCVRCHGRSGGVSLESYASVLPHLEAIRRVALVNKTMPPPSRGSLSVEASEILKSWLDAGAPE